MLLSALIVKGLTPGPNMLLPESQGGHLGLVQSLVWLMVIGNLIAVALCLVTSRFLVRVTRVPGTLLVPFILLLTLLGAFAEKNAVGDLFVTTALGALGLTMVRLGWPRVPLMLGLILGGLAESRFFLSMGAYGTDWLIRPGVLVLGLVMALSLVIPHRRSHVATAVSMQLHDDQRVSSDRDGSRLSLLFLIGLTVALTALVLFAGQLAPRAAVFPRLVMIPTLLLTLVQLGRSLRHPRGALFSLPVASSLSSGGSHVVEWAGLLSGGSWV